MSSFDMQGRFYFSLNYHCSTERENKLNVSFLWAGIRLILTSIFGYAIDTDQSYVEFYCSFCRVKNCPHTNLVNLSKSLTHHIHGQNCRDLQRYNIFMRTIFHVTKSRI